MSWSRLLWWRPPCLLRLVIVNLRSDSDTAIRGLLWGSRGPWLTLREASVLKVNTTPTPIDGETVIHRDNVGFVQVLP